MTLQTVLSNRISISIGARSDDGTVVSIDHEYIEERIVPEYTRWQYTKSLPEMFLLPQEPNMTAMCAREVVAKVVVLSRIEAHDCEFLGQNAKVICLGDNIFDILEFVGWYIYVVCSPSNYTRSQ